MALDLRALRTTAAREEREADKARAALAATIRQGEELLGTQGAPDAEVGRAAARIRTAAGRLGKIPDRLGELLARATPDEVLGALERDVPLVLLPVRLETRLLATPAGWDLAVRVYPDAIHRDVHEPDLLPAERDAGAAFWQRQPAAPDVAWAELAQLFGPQRAAWIAEATRVGTSATAGTAGARFTRPAWARALPDAFLFSVVADGVEVPLHEGARIVTPVPTGPDPGLTPDADDGTDAGMRWMTDLAVAVDRGMAARIPLGPTMPRRIDRVLVLGVRASLTPGDAASLLGGLLDAHRYTDGLEVLRVGTPTNAGAPGTPEGPRPAAEAAPAPAGHAIAAEADGARLARAIGVDAGRLAGVPGADATSDADARAMLTLLWPGTLGYFLRQMLQGRVDEDEAALLRAQAVDWVRGRGPLAPLRVGRTPYGVLPVTSLAGYRPGADEPAAERFVGLLRGLWGAWVDAAAGVPKAGRGSAADAGRMLAEILALAPVSVAIDARRVYPAGFVDILTQLSGMTADQGASMAEIARGLVRDGLSGLGRLSDDDELVNVLAAGGTTRVRIARVQAAPLSDAQPLVEDYLTFLRTAPVDDVVAAEERFGAPLLYLLARHALLQQYVQAAAESLGPAGDPYEALDRAVIIDDLPGIEGPKLALDLLRFPLPLTPGPGPSVVLPLGQAVREEAAPLAEHITMGTGFDQSMLDLGGAHPAAGVPPDAGMPFGIGMPMAPAGPAGGGRMRLRAAGTPAVAGAATPGTDETAQVLAALAHLAALPTATLDRLLRETLDLASHRLDAWVTSLAALRLSRMRATAPVGAHLGAYGVVRDLVTAPAPSRATPPGSPAGTADADATINQGFIHAPSLGHAATAAVLRSAHAAHGDTAAFAVTLESARVRGARAARRRAPGAVAPRPARLPDRARAPRPGRRLRDRQAARRRAPLRTSAIAPPAGAAFEAIAPRDVVDGLRIVRGDFTAPSLSSPEGAAVTVVVAEAADALDAAGDLLVAEGVHQMVAGTPARAAAAARAAAGTGPRPTARGGQDAAERDRTDPPGPPGLGPVERDLGPGGRPDAARPRRSAARGVDRRAARLRRAPTPPSSPIGRPPASPSPTAWR